MKKGIRKSKRGVVERNEGPHFEAVVLTAQLRRWKIREGLGGAVRLAKTVGKGREKD